MKHGNFLGYIIMFVILLFIYIAHISRTLKTGMMLV